MTEVERKNPEREAIRLSSFWQELGPNTYPLDIDELIEGAITRSGFSDKLVVDKNSFESFEGSLVRTRGMRKWTILLNSNIKNKRRQRFTFAHELGHFMCHREIRSSFEDNEETLNNFENNIELEANIFASLLLMPANLMREEFSTRTWKTETLSEIGSRFESSLQASAIRHVSLNPKPIAFVVSRDGMINWSCKSKSAPFMKKYCLGDDLPRDSHALSSHLSQCIDSDQYQSGNSWSDGYSSIESQYFDDSGRGYQYTCIEFV